MIDAMKNIFNFLYSDYLIRIQTFGSILFIDNTFRKLGIFTTTLLILTFMLVSALSNKIIYDANIKHRQTSYENLINVVLGKYMRIIYLICNITIQIMNILFFYQISANYIVDMYSTASPKNYSIYFFKFLFFLFGYLTYFFKIRILKYVNCLQYIILFAICLITAIEFIYFFYKSTGLNKISYNTISQDCFFLNFHHSCFISWGFYTQNLILNMRSQYSYIFFISNIVSSILLIVTGLLGYMRYLMTGKLFINSQVISYCIKHLIVLIFIIDACNVISNIRGELSNLLIQYFSRKNIYLIFEYFGPILIFIISIMRNDFFVQKIIFYFCGFIPMFFIPFLLALHSNTKSFKHIILLFFSGIFFSYFILMLVFYDKILLAN